MSEVKIAQPAEQSQAPTATAQEFLLVDLSSIAYPIWHTSQGDPDPNATSIKTVARVRALATSYPRAAVCADGGKSFRAEVDPQYKANRPESDATLQHQIGLAVETLRQDGFPVWMVRGFEADDLIATACGLALQIEGASVVIASADKDLLQLIGPRVCIKHAKDGAFFDDAAVVAKFGVHAAQMTEYLMLVGDPSDNIRGAEKIGAKTAAALLGEFGSLRNVYAALAKGACRATNPALTPSIVASLTDFMARAETVCKLVTMRTDVEIPFAEIMVDRTPKDAEDFTFTDDPQDEPAAADVKPEPEPERVSGTVLPAAPAQQERQAIVAAPAEYERQLDPRGLREAQALAVDMFKSRLFSAYGTAQGVLSTIMVGRELGLPAMVSLRSVHIIEGRHSLSATLMVALVLKSGLAEYFRPVSFSEVEATFETLRKGAGNRPVILQHKIEMAGTAGLLKPNSNWLKVPTDMLVSRAQSRLSRLVYPDVILGGMYTPEELQDIRGTAA